MPANVSLRSIPQDNNYRKGDVLILFGELFGRGYANGLINEARKAGMTIIGITIGRRDENNSLRPLSDEELRLAEDNLGGPIINVPLMAGFDLDAPVGEPTLTDLINSVTLSNWRDHKLDWSHVDKCRNVGVNRFKSSLRQVMVQLDDRIADNKNVLFAHSMAGGFLKSKILLSLANHIYKGRGNRFMSSRTLLNSDLGKLMLMNFEEVTAKTFQYLIDGSSAIRDRLQKSGGSVRYLAYGYHGTEIIINGSYQWQTYTNYTQGYAKMLLESIARGAWDRGIQATVFNCPEIRTNSSDIFVGLDLSLLPLLSSLKKEDGGNWAEAQWQVCRQLLNDGMSVEDLLEKIDKYNASSLMEVFRNFDQWPMDNTEELADLMIETSGAITQMHKDKRELIASHLSTLVLEGVGPLIFNESSNPSSPVLWLNHDIIAKQLNQMHR